MRTCAACKKASIMFMDENPPELAICSGCMAKARLQPIPSKHASFFGGIRHDQDKLDWSLVPMQHLEGMVRVLMFGAKKYAKHNWRKGLDYSRVTNSLQRHINAFNQGENTDPESGLPHTAHILCNALFLAGMEAEHPQLDDRYKNQADEQVHPGAQ